MVMIMTYYQVILSLLAIWTSCTLIALPATIFTDILTFDKEKK